MPDLAGHVERYRRDKAAWLAAPRASEVRKRLDVARKALEAAAEAFGCLSSTDLSLARLRPPDAHAALDSLDSLVAQIATGIRDLDARGARTGGNRRLAALFKPSPRFSLAAGIAAELAATGQPLGSAHKGLLRNLAVEALTEAGEADPERNLDNTLREVLKARRNLVSATRSDSPRLAHYPENDEELIST